MSPFLAPLPAPVPLPLDLQLGAAPAVVLVVLLLIGVIALVGAAIFKWDVVSSTTTPLAGRPVSPRGGLVWTIPSPPGYKYHPISEILPASKEPRSLLSSPDRPGEREGLREGAPGMDDPNRIEGKSEHPH